jgi:hypothetical protein
MGGLRERASIPVSAFIACGCDGRSAAYLLRGARSRGPAEGAACNRSDSGLTSRIDRVEGAGAHSER